jgi:hypothetical protein
VETPAPPPAPGGALVVSDPGPAPTGVAPTAPPTSAPPPSPAPPPPTADDPQRAAFEQTFPAHAAATQDPADPASTRWAVLIGINEHQGSTRDNLTSRQDAEALAGHLRSLGWREDHVLLLTDGLATRAMIVEAIRWLGRKTDGHSVAVFHYSGHTKQWPGRDVDGDGEIPDEALWPSDNRHIVDREFVDLMAAVEPWRLWINIGACEAAGFNDPGLDRAGRLLTFSSQEHEKSYENPSVGYTVWGQYLVAEALIGGAGDTDGDGDITVEEAVNHAVPRAAQRTAGERHGSQNGAVIDRVDGAFSLRIPPPPPPPPPPSPEPSPSPEPDPDDDRPCLLVCHRRD